MHYFLEYVLFFYFLLSYAMKARKIAWTIAQRIPDPLYVTYKTTPKSDITISPIAEINVSLCDFLKTPGNINPNAKRTSNIPSVIQANCGNARYA